MTIKTKKYEQRKTDSRALYRRMKGILGKKCWNVALGYGGELRLHFGARLPYESRKLPDKKKGSWIFGTCGTDWILITPQGGVSSREKDEEKLQEKAKVLEKRRVTGFGLVGPSDTFFLKFSDNSVFLVLPKPEDRKMDVPYWELFMPNHALIAFGPDSTWSCTRSDVPLS